MKTKDLVKTLGIMPKVKGYYYIIEAVELIRKKLGNPIVVTKDVYPLVAMKYYTSTECVERVIRTTIHNAWVHNKRAMDRVAGYPLRFNPTNKEFLFMLADYIEETQERMYTIKG